MDTWLNGRAIDRSIRLWSLLAYRSSVVIIITHSGRRLLSVSLSGCLVTFTTLWGSIHPAKLNMYRIRNWWKCFSKFSAFGISASIVFFILSSTDFSVTLLKGVLITCLIGGSYSGGRKWKSITHTRQGTWSGSIGGEPWLRLLYSLHFPIKTSVNIECAKPDFSH